MAWVTEHTTLDVLNLGDDGIFGRYSRSASTLNDTETVGYEMTVSQLNSRASNLLAKVCSTPTIADDFVDVEPDCAPVDGFQGDVTSFERQPKAIGA